MSKLPLPGFFTQSSAKADQVWRTPYQQRALEARDWALTHGLQHAGLDKTKVALLGVDVMNTFVTPGFELVVGGAVADTVRTAEFIYRNLGVITSIHPTLDTHLTYQIFHESFWVNDKGEHPITGAMMPSIDPATGAQMTLPGGVITLDDVESGEWKLDPAVAVALGQNYIGLQQHVLHYVRELTKGGKYPLMIWPYHAMLGGIGHALVSVFEEACFFHSVARRNQIKFEIKGGNPLVENYSIFRPEVLIGHNGSPIAQKNTKFLQTLLTNDIVIILGQAKSHCVAWAIDDLLTEIMSQDRRLASKVYLVDDCTSPVVVPGVVDFTKDANDAFARFANAGMHLVKSTDPIESWPGVNL